VLFETIHVGLVYVTGLGMYLKAFGIHGWQHGGLC
jgi:hypothetical protein